MMTVPAPCAAAICLDRRRVLVALGRIGFGDVADIEYRVRGKQVQPLQRGEVLGATACRAGLRAGFPSLRSVRTCSMTGRTVRASLSLRGGALAELDDAPLEALEVCQHQLRLDRLCVGDRDRCCLRHG